MSRQPSDAAEAAADEALVRSFVDDGDTAALEVLLTRHEGKIFGLAYRILGNRADALDATQEVFLAVFRRAGSFQHRSAFSTWLYRLTVNACHDLGRSKARHPAPSEHLPPGDPPVGDPDQRLDIQAALMTLPDDQRTVVVMRDLYQMSYREIAEAAGVPAGTVKSRIARARRVLADKLSEGTGGIPPAV